MNGSLNGTGGHRCSRPHTLVTGASSGIRRATALRLAAAGHHVYAEVRRTADGDELVRDVTAGHAGRHRRRTHRRRRRLRRPALGHWARRSGSTTPGSGSPAPPSCCRWTRSGVNWRSINVVGQLALTQAFLPLLRQAQGRIVVISAIGVRFLPPFAGPLDATKAALAALADALRQELAPWRIRVVLVQPASINSPAADKVARDAAATMASATPQGRPVRRASPGCSR